MLETFMAGPFIRVGASFAVELEAVTGPDFLADELAAFEVLAVVAISVDDLAVNSLLLVSRFLARLVTNKRKGIPIAVCDGACFLIQRVIAVSAQFFHQVLMLPP